MALTVDDDAPSVGVASVRPIDIREWRKVYHACAQATFFHGPTWAEIWEAYTDRAVRACPRRVEFEDGCSAVIGATSEPTRLPRVRRDALSPKGNCGGWVSSDALTERHASVLAKEILRSPAVTWRRGPADPLACAVRVAGERTEETHVVDLRNGAEAARARWKPEARRRVRQARGLGARLRRAESRDDWLAYDGLYRDTLGRWQRPLELYDRSLFSLLFELDSDEIALWLVERDGAPVAGSVVFTHGTHAVGWHRAGLPDACPGCANLLDWELIGRLADEGFATYDLNGSGPLPGVVRFKESIGGERRPVLAVERRHPAERLARRIRRLRPGVRA